MDQFEQMRIMQDVGTYYVAIPDVHGRIDELDRVLSGVNSWIKSNGISKNNVKFVFLGDYIDRGPNPREVIMRVKEYVDKHDAICLLGNHDMFLIGTAEMSKTTFANGRQAYQSNLWSINNGIECCRQLYGVPDDLADAVTMNFAGDKLDTGTDVNRYRDIIYKSDEYKFLKDHGKLYFQTDSIFFSHAAQSSKEYTDNTLVWSKNEDYDHPKGDGCFIVPNNRKMSIHGHYHRVHQGIVFPRIHNYIHGGVPKQVIMSDSGCGCGGKLFAVIVKDYVMNKQPTIIAII